MIYKTPVNVFILLCLLFYYENQAFILRRHVIIAKMPAGEGISQWTLR
jgi:hypothetical protein